MAPIKFINCGPFESDTYDQEYALTSWSLIHLLSGIILGFVCWQFHKNDMMVYSVSVSLSVAGLVLWEPFERYTWSEEHLMNQMADVILGLSSLYVVLLVVGAE